MSGDRKRDGLIDKAADGDRASIIRLAIIGIVCLFLAGSGCAVGEAALWGGSDAAPTVVERDDDGEWEDED